MSDLNEVLEQNNIDLPQEQVEGRITLTIAGNDFNYTFEQLSVNFDSSESEILNAVSGLIREQNMSLNDGDGNVAYTVRKAVNTQTVYVYPKPIAGKF